MPSPPSMASSSSRSRRASWPTWSPPLAAAPTPSSAGAAAPPPSGGGQRAAWPRSSPSRRGERGTGVKVSLLSALLSSLPSPLPPRFNSVPLPLRVPPCSSVSSVFLRVLCVLCGSSRLCHVERNCPLTPLPPFAILSSSIVWPVNQSTLRRRHAADRTP